MKHAMTLEQLLSRPASPYTELSSSLIEPPLGMVWLRIETPSNPPVVGHVLPCRTTDNAHFAWLIEHRWPASAILAHAAREKWKVRRVLRCSLRDALIWHQQQIQAIETLLDKEVGIESPLAKPRRVSSERQRQIQQDIARAAADP